MFFKTINAQLITNLTTQTILKMGAKEIFFVENVFFNIPEIIKPAVV